MILDEIDFRRVELSEWDMPPENFGVYTKVRLAYLLSGPLFQRNRLNTVLASVGIAARNEMEVTR
jgi:hypothetical protein